MHACEQVTEGRQPCIRIGDTIPLMEGREEALLRLRTEQGGFAELMQQHGHMPLPPYIQRADTASDRERYQTVYLRSAQARSPRPPAGLHFDHAMPNGWPDGCGIRP